jgi:hypothetical protein
MTGRAHDKVFRDLHEALTEWTCQYCKDVATTVRHGAAVCSQHSHPWAIGIELAALQASLNH